MNEKLEGVGKESELDMLSLANIGASVLSPRMWLRTLRSGTGSKFRKIEPEMSLLLMTLNENLKDLAKEKTGNSNAASSKAL
ncbi:MAG TPA: hypothetical protein VK487_09180 [Candidatus Bathyarchaeia archaeon]|nr:hypothetical protein [Candidatus Bathyarchaeia archaeon]